MPFSISACSEDSPVLNPPCPPTLLQLRLGLLLDCVFLRVELPPFSFPVHLFAQMNERPTRGTIQFTFFYLACVLLKDEAGLMGHKTIKRFFKNAMVEFRG